MKLEQLDKGLGLARQIEYLKTLRESIKNSKSITFGEGYNSASDSVITGRYVSDIVGEKSVTIVHETKHEIPAWAAQILSVSKVVLLASLEIEIETVQKQFDEL